MGFWSRIKDTIWADSTLANPSVELSMALLGGSTTSGEYVTSRSAQKVPTLLAGINLLANDISSLPLYLMVRTRNGVQMAVSHPLFRRLHDNWSPELTAREGLEHSVRMLITTGNFYNLLNPDGTIVPLYAPNVTPRRLTKEQAAKIPPDEVDLVFDYIDPATGTQKTFYNSQIWRASVGSQYGLVGESSLYHGRDAIGTALAADKASAKLFKQGSITDGYFSAEPGQGQSKAEWDKLIAAWGKGAEGAFRKVVLPPGVKYNPMTLLNAAQAQFIERAKQSGLDMCRLLNIPASILDASETGDTYAASESQRRWYVDHTLRPWLVLIQQSINLRCLSDSERDIYYSEFNTDSLLDADLQARYTGYNSALVGHPWMTVNEVRRAEGLNPLPGYDVLKAPTNNFGESSPVLLPKPKAQAHLEHMVRASAERVVRREQKSKKYEPDIVAESLCISLEQAQEYCAMRQSGEITDDNAVDALTEYAIEMGSRNETVN